MNLTSLAGLLVVISSFISCNNSTESQEGVDQTVASSTESKEGVNHTVTSSAKNNTQRDLPTHLQDSFKIKESVLLFLIPDSTRFASVAEREPGIYDADADFGVGIYNTIDSIAKNNKYQSIKTHNTAKRYILIEDCKECPLVIDRDTVNYGIILSARGQTPQTKFNEVHSGDYLQEVNEYFQLK